MTTHTYLRRLVCQLWGRHRWRLLEGHWLCLRCWAEYDPTTKEPIQ